ncbi:MAG TPA: hypothetical protein VE957_01215 [Terriglobales bacterium]|nr:hypothetical protein [Terriglobales bacterium]
MATSEDKRRYLSGDKVSRASAPQGQGIPTVQDRFIQQMMLQVLTPIFDPKFSEHSYGFRPGRKAQALGRRRMVTLSPDK